MNMLVEITERLVPPPGRIAEVLTRRHLEQRPLFSSEIRRYVKITGSRPSNGKRL